MRGSSNEKRVNISCITEDDQYALTTQSEAPV